MTIFRSKRTQFAGAAELTRTLRQLAERNAELRLRQQALEKRIRELELLRAALYPTHNRT